MESPTTTADDDDDDNYYIIPVRETLWRIGRWGEEGGGGGDRGGRKEAHMLTLSSPSM